MNRFNNLSEDAKVVYLLSLSNLIINKVSESEGFEVAVESLEKAWEWLKLKDLDADSLYVYLENIDETDIMTYMQLEDDKDNEKVWICIGNALAYTIWEAYQYEKEKYLPQTIESVDYQTIESFITNFEKVYENNSTQINYYTFLKKTIQRMLIKG
ncbi:Imm6 family immunity protein [Priestia megaterium]|uniref:Imm6 family immunity protein n=1 Tax=Priestia megaterium TaxID=1404 RepID=UPI0022B8C998|nr:Imm6 family immunity protein [Priestia megaterium]MCZ8493860.1 Imm6 family immunity protein [Priestia megaterium]